MADSDSDFDNELDRVPTSGSCARCGEVLDLASLKFGERWYCSPACALGTPSTSDARRVAVPETWLYSRPRRYFRPRAPKELRRS